MLLFFLFLPPPLTVCKEPPYKVEESGYAGFIMPIEVYFKNKVSFLFSSAAPSSLRFVSFCTNFTFLGVFWGAF